MEFGSGVLNTIAAFYNATDEAALRYLQSAVPGVETPGRAVPLASGRRRRFWEKNCVALGASAIKTPYALKVK